MWIEWEIFRVFFFQKQKRKIKTEFLIHFTGRKIKLGKMPQWVLFYHFLYDTISCFETIFYLNIIFSMAINNILLIFKKLALVFYKASLNFLIVAVFSITPFYGKTSPVKNVYLLTFPEDKVEILVFLSKSYWALLCSILLSVVSIFLPTVIL